jgi:hypothetical protein
MLMGNRAFKPTPILRKMVKSAYGLGMRQKDICLLLRSENDIPMDTKTLRKHFKEELEVGRAPVEYRIRQSAWQVASDPNHPKFSTMNIWVQKTLLGINETQVHEVTGPDGEPLSSAPSWVVVVGKE